MTTRFGRIPWSKETILRETEDSRHSGPASIRQTEPVSVTSDKGVEGDHQVISGGKRRDRGRGCEIRVSETPIGLVSLSLSPL